MKLSAIANKTKFLVLTFWLRKIDTLLNSRLVTVERNQDLTRRAIENNRSPDTLLHGFTWRKAMTFISSETDNLSCIFKFLAAVEISSNVRKIFFPNHCPKQSKF